MSAQRYCAVGFLKTALFNSDFEKQCLCYEATMTVLCKGS